MHINLNKYVNLNNRSLFIKQRSNNLSSVFINKHFEFIASIYTRLSKFFFQNFRTLFVESTARR